MSIHPAVVARFGLLDGITSFEQLMSEPELEERFHQFMQYPDATPPPDTMSREVRVQGPHAAVRVRVYEPLDGQLEPLDSASAASPSLVWMHGGAFRMGGLDMPEADRTAREVCTRARAVVVSVDYRLCVGGVHYPVPLDDCVAVVRWVLDNAAALRVDPHRIVVGGASAGGNLAVGATLKLRDEDGWLPAALLPVYAPLHPRLPAPSPRLARLLDEVPDVLRFSADEVKGITENYLGGPVNTSDGYAMPGLADLGGLCPTVVVNAEYDDLRPSGEAFAAALAVAGVDVRQCLVRRMLHGFLNLPPEIEPVDGAFDLLADVVGTSRALDLDEADADLVPALS